MKLEVIRSQHHEPHKVPFSLTAKVTLTDEEQALLARYPRPAAVNYLDVYPEIWNGQTFYDSNVYKLHDIEADIQDRCRQFANYLIAAQEYGGHEEYEFTTFPFDS
ncbi:MAG: hypothetical protein M3R24_15855 [Chloroflexota bacterium]|nr:hypothetical protein [Chloroflexota bacterium]